MTRYAIKKDGTWSEIREAFYADQLIDQAGEGGEVTPTVDSVLYSADAPGLMSAEQRAELAIAEILPASGQAAWTARTGISLQDVAGVPHEVIETRAMTLAEVKTELNARINAHRDGLAYGGYRHNFGGEVGERVLQTRATPDQANWLLARQIYADMVAAGDGQTEGAVIRAEDNASITLSYADALALITAMMAWGAAVMQHGWNLKDAVNSAQSVAAAIAIDINAGWPAN